MTLGSCIRLEYLGMVGNFFQGTNSTILGSLGGVKQLYLFHNNLSGVIPKFLQHFQSVQYFNLSYNNSKGVVPINGVFKNATATSVEGTSKLCGGIPNFICQYANFNIPAREDWALK